MPYKNVEERRTYQRKRYHEYKLKYPGRWEATARRTNLNLKHETLESYGGSCDCCGEMEPTFLAIDHIDGVWPKGVYITGGKLWRWLRDNDYPEGFRVLCHNCNFAVSHGRICPHQVIDEVEVLDA